MVVSKNLFFFGVFPEPGPGFLLAYIMVLNEVEMVVLKNLEMIISFYPAIFFVPVPFSIHRTIHNKLENYKLVVFVI